MTQYHYMQVTPIRIILALTIIDILYTGYGAFYGGGGAELNPLFSWATDPTIFMAAIIIGKIVGVGLAILLIWWVESRNQKWGAIIGTHASVVYGAMLLAVLATNVWYQVSAGG